MEHKKIDVFVDDRMSWYNPIAWVPRFPPETWLKTSFDALEKAERNILTGLWDKIQEKFVTIHQNTHQIRTITLNKDAKNTPLVMVHGMGSGVGLFVLNYEALSQNRTVHAFDQIGFGRSSRPKFSTDAFEAEAQFVESMEEWRKAMDIDKFILLGHSLGGFLAAAYALKYPERIRHLILADPWGFPHRPDEDEFKKKFQIPWYIKGVAYLLKPFNPLAGLRALGPWGPGAVTKLRPDLMRKFAHLYDDDTVAQYIYHCNAQVPSGETAFHALSQAFGWAKQPMVERIGDIPAHVPITMIYGSRSWMDSSVGWHIKYKRPNSYVDIHVIKGAGHHVYADRAADFNTLVNRICNIVDQEFDLDTQSPLGAYKRLRRYSETSLEESQRGMRRRTQSECPPDSMEGTSFALRANQTFAGMDQFKEEGDDSAQETQPVAEQVPETSVVAPTKTDSDKHVKFTLYDN